ncbi:MAG: lipid-A-disaccharide synthase [Chlorobiaceae bacterium]|nr:lipid-A-disaccharide synthase [Chlorobiaceae bacterium]MBA4309146.1 lipid-A-disaccharide synthase [Chlorobiaceae bacterium]
MKKEVLIIAGEDSGDLHGSSLIAEIKKISPQINFCGIGGDRMKSNGMDLIYHINKMSFLGFVEVVKHIPFIKKVQKDLLKIVEEKKIKTAVLIDYPGFNLNFAKKLQANGVNIIYYISPQIWAWGSGRIEKIKKLVKKMIVVFPFEEKIYKEHGVDAEFVGNPLIERMNHYNFLSKEDLYKKFSLDNAKEILLLLAGSRKQEIVKIFPETIKAAISVAKNFNLQVVVACASNINEKEIQDLSEEKNYKVIKGFTYDLMKHSKVGIVKSGTSTIEAALLELPMVIVYRTSWLTYTIGKQLINLKNIGMPNIIAGETVVPELIQNDVNQKEIENKLTEILSDGSKLNSIKEKLSRIKNILGSKNASSNAAKIICDEINEH